MKKLIALMAILATGCATTPPECDNDTKWMKAYLELEARHNKLLNDTRGE